MNRKEGKKYVYLASANDSRAYKIGETIDIPSRFKRKEKNKAYKMNLISCVEVNETVALDIESYLHRYFEKYLLCADWFALEQQHIDAFPKMVKELEVHFLEWREFYE